MCGENFPSANVPPPPPTQLEKRVNRVKSLKVWGKAIDGEKKNVWKIAKRNEVKISTAAVAEVAAVLVKIKCAKFCSFKKYMVHKIPVSLCASPSRHLTLTLSPSLSLCRLCVRVKITLSYVPVVCQVLKISRLRMSQQL